jgi:hypothetical protein
MKHMHNHSILSLFFYIAVVSGLFLSCNSKRGDSTLGDISTNDFIEYNIEGIYIDLPSPPSPPRILPTGANVAHIIKRQVGYEANIEGCAIVVFHLEQAKQYTINKDFAIEGAIEKMKAVPGTTDFTALIVDRYQLPELDKTEMIIRCKINGSSMCVYLLIIAKDNNLYQISIEGKEDLVDKVASHTFPSIKVP